MKQRNKVTLFLAVLLVALEIALFHWLAVQENTFMFKMWHPDGFIFAGKTLTEPAMPPELTQYPTLKLSFPEYQKLRDLGTHHIVARGSSLQYFVLWNGTVFQTELSVILPTYLQVEDQFRPIYYGGGFVQYRVAPDYDGLVYMEIFGAVILLVMLLMLRVILVEGIYDGIMKLRGRSPAPA